MNGARRLVPAALVAAVLVLAAPAALADEAISRRLAALKSLVDPEAARRAARPASPADVCSAGAWWRVTDYGLRSRSERAIRDAALRFAVAPALIRAVIRHESDGNPAAVSHKGAQGMMQLMPATARSLGVVCAFDPRENILGGTRYLRRMYDRLGSWPRALAAYHAGPARVESGRIPRETHRYVERIVRSWSPARLVSLKLP